MSTASAEQVVTDTVHAARALLGDEIAAIYTLGSLAHGGFAPLVSDIDVAIVLERTDAASADRIAEVQARVRANNPSPLAKRLSLFWGDWQLVQTGDSAFGRLGPVDRLDLLDSGRLLVGTDRREPSVRPTSAQLLTMSADFILQKFTPDYLAGLTDTETLLAGGVRVVTKVVLFPVRFLYTARTGRIGLNDSAVEWYAAEDLPGAPLAQAALHWRHTNITDLDIARHLLDADLATIHAECLTEYARSMEDLADPHRAGELAERAASVPVSGVR